MSEGVSLERPWHKKNWTVTRVKGGIEKKVLAHLKDKFKGQDPTWEEIWKEVRDKYMELGK